MKCLLVCNTVQNVINFRQPLIRKLIDRGYEVVVVAGEDSFRPELNESEIKFYSLETNNRSANILKSAEYKKNIYKIISEEKPDIVFTFQVKPNTFGVFAAKKAGVKNIFSMVEGAGDPFIKTGFKWGIIRRAVCFLYRKAFKNVKKVFFLNNDDKSEFIKRKLVKNNQCEVVHGIGVDLNKFSYKPIKNYKTFLMVARMLKTKGVYEYCECARIVKEKYPDAVFNYLGAEGDVKVSDIKEYIDDGSINYLGTTKDVRPFYEEALLLLLSSYREGCPMSVMEAEAMGRAVITSDNVGCRDTVKNDYNGFLVPKGNAIVMAEKVIWCIEHPMEVEQMGKNARKFAEENFNAEKINDYIVGKILLN